MPWQKFRRSLAALLLLLACTASPSYANVWSQQFGVIPSTSDHYSNLISVTGSFNFHTYDDQFFNIAGDLRKWPMVRCGPNYSDPHAAASVAAQHPGHIWIICNEPELLGQDGYVGMTFPVLAQQIHDYISVISAADPTAQFVGPNVGVERADWDTLLARTYESMYPPRPGGAYPWDYNGVHVYVPVSRLSPALFTFWCGGRTDGCSYTIVTEFGQNDADPVGYVNRAVGVFKSVGLSQWFVFSDGNVCGACVTTNLLNPDGSLSPTGHAWQILEGIR